MKIKDLNGKVLLTVEGDTLIGADLFGANLYFADLEGAKLEGAKLEGAYLRGANLQYADLEDANLRGANFRNVNLLMTNLQGAKYNKDTKFPSPFELLKADWGECSDELTIDLMNFDCAFHPIGPPAFAEWVETGICPYNDSAFQRVVNFNQKKELWRYKKNINIRQIIYDLMKEKMVAVL